MSPALIISVAALLIGPLVAYLGIVRRASGKIRSSEAGQLWEESTAIRTWATNRISELNTVVQRLEEKVEQLEKRNEGLYLENGRLTTLLEEHTATIAELRDQMHRLALDNERLREENVTLRARVDELEGGSNGSAAA